MIEPSHRWNTSFKPLVGGFLLSLALLFLAYFSSTRDFFSGWALIGVLFFLAVVQAVIQLVYFLHLGIEEKPRWNLMIFFFMLFIMVVILGGSMWIMRNLDYYLMGYMQ